MIFPEIEELINEQTDLSEEDKEILRKLADEPTSLSADLVPKATSFDPQYALTMGSRDQER